MTWCCYSWAWQSRSCSTFSWRWRTVWTKHSWRWLCWGLLWWAGSLVLSNLQVWCCGTVQQQHRSQLAYVKNEHEGWWTYWLQTWSEFQQQDQTVSDLESTWTTWSWRRFDFNSFTKLLETLDIQVLPWSDEVATWILGDYSLLHLIQVLHTTWEDINWIHTRRTHPNHILDVFTLAWPSTVDVILKSRTCVCSTTMIMTLKCWNQSMPSIKKGSFGMIHSGRPCLHVCVHSLLTSLILFQDEIWDRTS